MASCPVCQNGIEILDSHMGTLYNCPHCGGVFFIGWDGQPELASKEDAPIDQPVEQFAAVEMAEPMQTTQIGSEVQETVYQTLPSLETPLEEAMMGGEPMFGEIETPPENFAEVTNFGNSTQAGNLSYTLSLKGVELEESLRALREALTDSRFGWNTDELMSRVIATGELVLRGINPTKASILVGRIKFLPIEIVWTQEVFDV